MELMTTEIAQALRDAPHDPPVEMAPIVVKYFNPCGAQTWFISEGEEQHGNGQSDWELFGWCELGFGPGCSELGYVMLSELESLTLPGGLGIERDLYYGPHMLSEVMD